MFCVTQSVVCLVFSSPCSGLSRHFLDKLIKPKPKMFALTPRLNLEATSHLILNFKWRSFFVRVRVLSKNKMSMLTFYFNPNYDLFLNH